MEDSLVPTEDLKEFQIIPLKIQNYESGNLFNKGRRKKFNLHALENIDRFAWSPSNMPIVDDDIIINRLTLNTTIKSIIKKK